eukprot:549712_1
MDEEIAICIQFAVGVSICVATYLIRNIIDNKFDEKEKNDLNKKLRISLTITITIIFWLMVPNTHGFCTSQFAVIFCCFFAVISAKMILFYGEQKRKKQTLTQYMCEIVWIIFPISKTKSIKHNAESPKQFTVYNIMHHFVINSLPIFVYLYFITICTFVLHTYLMKCLSTKEKVELLSNNYFYFTFYCWLMTLLGPILLLPNLLAFNDTLIKLFTLNRYEGIIMNNYPLLALSIKELWNKRYNQWIRIFLRENIFIPLISYGVSKSFAAFIVFFISAMFHSWISWKWVQNLYWVLSTFIFFILHGFATILESFMFGKDIKNSNMFIDVIIRYAWTISFFIFSSPLLFGQIIENFVEITDIVWKFQSQFIPYNNTIVDYVETYKCIYPQ